MHKHILFFFAGPSLLTAVTSCKYTLLRSSPLRSVRWGATFTGTAGVSATWSHHRFLLRPLGRIPSILPVTIKRSILTALLLFSNTEQTDRGQASVFFQMQIFKYRYSRVMCGPGNPQQATPTPHSETVNSLPISGFKRPGFRAIAKQGEDQRVNQVYLCSVANVSIVLYLRLLCHGNFRRSNATSYFRFTVPCHRVTNDCSQIQEFTYHLVFLQCHAHYLYIKFNYVTFHINCSRHNKHKGLVN